MKEEGIDISKHFSKSVDDLKNVKFDVVFTVCEHANENCPLFFDAPEVKHVRFDDPPKLAAGLMDEEEILSHYRRIRDEIREFVKFLNI